LADAVNHLILHDLMMWLPSSCTARMISCIGVENTLLFGVAEFLVSFSLMLAAAFMKPGAAQKILVWVFILILGAGWNAMWLAVTQMLKDESAFVQTFTESAVNFANVAFLLITCLLSDPWVQMPCIGYICSAMLVLCLCLKRLPTRGSSMSSRDDSMPKQVVTPAEVAVDVVLSPTAPQFCSEVESVQTPASRMNECQGAAGHNWIGFMAATFPLRNALDTRSINSTPTVRTLLSGQSGMFLVSPSAILAHSTMFKRAPAGHRDAPPSEEVVSSTV